MPPAYLAVGAVQTRPYRRPFSCDGKQRHETYRIAEIVRRGRENVHAYRCKFCHCWHLGTRKSVSDP